MTRTGIGKQRVINNPPDFNTSVFRDLSLGHRVGFYQIKGNIGKGNFSSVKIAIHALTKGIFVNVYYLSSCDKIRIVDLSYYIGIPRFLTFLFSYCRKGGCKSDRQDKAR